LTSLRKTDGASTARSLPVSRLGAGLAALAAVALLMQLEACLQRRSGATIALATFAIVFGAALVSSVVGFAFSALAGAGLMHLYAQPSQAVQIMAVCSVSIQLYCVVAMWNSIQWRRLVPFLAGGVPVAPVGVWLLSRVSYGAFAIGLGSFLVGYGAFMLWRRPSRAWKGSPWIDVLVGALGGITGGLAAFPGAFVSIWCGMRGWNKEAQRGVVQPYILLMQLVTLLAMRTTHVASHFDAASIEYLVAAVFAAHLGVAVFRTLGNTQFAWLVNALLMVSGSAMVLRAL
jgi:uncharacterized membrane protein YfcA